MIFKEGDGWKCCYDPETGLYTAKTGSCCLLNRRAGKGRIRDGRSFNEIKKNAA